MIVVKLIGGLGNQMFQYALGKSLSEKCGAELKLDVSGFGAYVKRRYELDAFNIREDFASAGEIESLVAFSRWRKLLRKIAGKKKGPPSSYRAEKHFHFDPEILKLSDGCYLDGYWQSEKYFVAVEKIIRKEFTFKSPPEGENRRLLELIGASNAISVHFRRGDYVSDPEVRAAHGCCSPDYYRRCIDWFLERIPDPHFFVFSDDISWVKNNLDTSAGRFTFVENNGAQRGFEDLRLMSNCRHHIIANSSFSWWGAWLDADPHKRVLAPSRWFGRFDGDTKDLFPQGWIKIEN